jgi:hypothetical protein
MRLPIRSLFSEQYCVPCFATPAKPEQNTAPDYTPIAVAVIGGLATILAAYITSR